MSDKKLRLLHQVPGALDRALDEQVHSTGSVPVTEQAEKAVQDSLENQEVPVCLIEEASGKYVLVFKEGRRRVCKSKGHAIDLARGYGLESPVFIPFNEVYDPTRPTEYFNGSRGLNWNVYERSIYQLVQAVKSTPTTWPTIQLLLENVFPDQRIRDAFLNWFAVVFQTGKMTGTAWVILGSQGSGKTMLMTELLFPLLGKGNCVQLNQDALTTRFNALLSRKQLVCFNEVHSSELAAERIKGWITDPDLRIETKSGQAEMETNHLNLIFTSNAKVPVKLEADDRRFSVARTGAPLVDLDWFKGEASVKAMKRELKAFAVDLQTYTIDAGEARRPVQSEDKLRLIEASVHPVDRLADMLRRRKVKELQTLAGDVLTEEEISEISGFSDRLRKDLLVKIVNTMDGAEYNSNTLTRALKERGFGTSKCTGPDGKPKPAYTWGVRQNSEKSEGKQK